MQQIHNLREQYEDPTGKNPKDFAMYQKGFNDAHLSRLRAEFTDQQIIEFISKRTGISADDIAITVTGSDGRGEKGLSSTIELMTIVNGEYETIETSKSRTREAIREILGHYPNDLFDARYPEVKSPHDTDLGLYVRPDFKLSMPSRVLDAQTIVGNVALLPQIRPLIVNELQGPNGKVMIDGIKARQRNARSTHLTGKARFKGSETMHYDMSLGQSHYRPSEHVTSFKQGPLRMGQQRALLALMTLGRNIATSEAQRIFSDVPNNLVERLYFLLNEQQFGTYSQVTDFTSLYTYFLWQYAISEYEYTRTRNSVVNFDAKEVKERLQAMLHLDDQFAAAKIKIKKSSQQ